ncbi:MAG: recombinase family protein [Clostridiales bacterium]|nr:recombinase family protein [Clostridiales bacterium]
MTEQANAAETRRISDTEPETGEGKFLSTEALSQRKCTRKATLRVAAYIRVSSPNPEQEDSYELQERYFTRLLTEHPRWTSAGVYSDYALSGTDGGKRAGFTRLLRHAREGRIDRIVSKSISRFARNTSDFLVAMKTLNEHAVTIYFEKENLDTADPTSVFIMTTLGAIAQEESRSISENIRWGFRKRYPRGEARNVAVYGYRYAEGEGAYERTESGYRLRRVEPEEGEAQVVRRIFRDAAAGQNCRSIARGLNRDGVPAPKGKRKGGRRSSPQPTRGEQTPAVEVGWTGERVRGILGLERYAGDLLLQKQFTADYLTHRAQVNRGELPQYYVKDHHPPLISRELLREARQVCRANRSCPKGGSAGCVRYPLSGRLVCAHCGRLYHTYNRNSYPIWACATSRLNNGKGACPAERIYEEQVLRMFRRAVVERYHLVQGPLRDDYTADDILSGRCLDGDSLLTEGSSSLVWQMRARLAAVHNGDTVERDRAFLRRQLLTLQAEGERLEGKLHMARAGASDGSLTDGEAAAAISECDRLEQRLRENTAAVEAQTERMNRLERYWAELETDYAWREKALDWLETLPPDRAGAAALLNGMTAEHLSAFARSITVHSPLKYTVHWFDGASTDVEMDSNIPDHRRTASYWDGTAMRDNPRRRPPKPGKQASG